MSTKKFTEIQPVSDAFDSIGGNENSRYLMFKSRNETLKGAGERTVTLTPKTLTSFLRDLGRTGIIKREVLPTVPVTVEYIASTTMVKT
jgi:DNA-binding HxlR family transcriptional regulator